MKTIDHKLETPESPHVASLQKHTAKAIAAAGFAGQLIFTLASRFDPENYSAHAETAIVSMAIGYIGLAVVGITPKASSQE